MKEKIMNSIMKVEKAHNVKVIFACEAGSRSWGFHSMNSDYDVRFIYVHTVDWYLSIDQKRDVIEIPINKTLDFNGWDLRKALLLLRKSNPSLLEWLHSETVYDKNAAIMKLIEQAATRSFSEPACIHHYLSMAKRNDKDLSETGPYKLKKILNILRPLLACKWMESNHSFPPQDFQNLVEMTIQDENLKKEIKIIIERKVAGEQWMNHSNLLCDFIRQQISSLEEYAMTPHHCHQSIHWDHLFQSILKESWDVSCWL